jgi:hypothetical protein
MPARAIIRRKTSFAFTVGTFGLISLLTGLIGFQLRGHYGPDTRPLGYWTGGLVWEQIVVGVVCVIAASLVFYKVNREL